MKTLKSTLIVFSMLCATMVYSQVKDKKTKSIRIPAEKSDKEKADAVLAQLQIHAAVVEDHTPNPNY